MLAKIKKYIRENSPVTDSDLNAYLSQVGSVSSEQKLAALNKLISSSIIVPSQNEEEMIVYRWQTQEQTERLNSLVDKETLILQLLRDAGNKGLWNDEVKKKTDMSKPQINKILQNLEGRGLVFKVKSEQHRNRIYWFSEGATPESGITGGIFTEGKEFNRVKHSNLFSYAKLALQNQTLTLEQLAENLKKHANLKAEDVESVITAMKAQGDILEIENGVFSGAFWDVPEPVVPPCVGCSLRNVCSEEGEINPSNCEYLKKWLDY